MRRGAAALLLAGAALARAQDSAADPHAAQPERPTVATHAYTVAPGWIEVESGLQFDRFEGGQAFSTPTTLKLGLAPRLQVEATFAWIDLGGSAAAQGMSDVILALKWRAPGRLPLLGDFAVQPAIRLPTGADSVGSGRRAGSIVFVSSNHFGPVELDVNLGLVTRIGASALPLQGWWTASAGTNVAGRLGWALEIYGYPGTSGADAAAPLVGLLTGPTWTVHDWFVLDAGAVVPVSGPQPHSLYMGLTWNIGRVWGPPPNPAPSR